jgi:hypothetical protein
MKTEVRDVDRIQITKVYAGWPSGGGGHTRPSVRHKHMLFPPACIFPLITEDLLGRAATDVYF